MVPVLITAWKRPSKVKRLISRLREIAPEKVFAACDGPSSVADSIKVEETRRIIESEIDWPCELYTLFNETNLGCRMGMTKAINWFFTNVEEGIILEDDCIPHYEFFQFCTELLERYRNNERIFSISGNNFQDSQWRGDGSYYLSQYFHCWGWASWRRSWNKFDSNLQSWESLKEFNILSSIFTNKKEEIYWTRIWDRLQQEGKPDSWAYRMAFTSFINGGLTIIPNKNLVENIGFDKDATHTTLDNFDTSINEGLMPLVHPKFDLRNIFADEYTFLNHFYKSSFIYRLRKFCKQPLYYPYRMIQILNEKR